MAGVVPEKCLPLKSVTKKGVGYPVTEGSIKNKVKH